MSSNQKVKNIVYQISSILIVAGVVVYLISKNIAPYLTGVGVIGYLISLFLNPYPGTSFRGKRLTTIQFIGGLVMGVATYFMFIQSNIWILFMFVAAIITLYCSFMIPRVWKKEQGKDE